ncbi:MAG TPA: ATP-binding protein [Acidimicrobiales bacterium]|nr:ATP-binding protein [Acidimicrobiales bacterium]
MQIILALSLPRDEQTIPVSRHIAVNAMAEIGVVEDCMHDIAVALTEACTNVLKHSGPGDEFEVSLEVDDDQCYIRVVDTGHGFDSAAVGFSHADTSAEQGRGIELMRALVDSVKFVSKPEAGTVVHLEKTLEFEDDSFVSRSKTAPGR